MDNNKKLIKSKININNNNNDKTLNNQKFKNFCNGSNNNNNDNNLSSKQLLKRINDKNELNKINSFIYNNNNNNEEDDDEDDDELYEEKVEDEGDDEDDDDDDDEDFDVDEDIDQNNLILNNSQGTTSYLDNDTKAKLELLLANTGIENITNDLFKDPQIMKTLKTTYVKTLSETKTQLLNASSTLQNDLTTTNTASAVTTTNTTNNLNNDKKLENGKNIIESTLQEFVLASSSSENDEHESLNENDTINKQINLVNSNQEITASSAENILSKLIEMQSSTSSTTHDDNSPQRKNQKSQQGKSLTELLEENADSVLGLACASGYIELVTVLLAINANVEDKGHKNETTPLMEACANGHKQIVELLLKHGANVNAQSACGNTSLHYAVQHNHVDIVKILIDNGARIEEANGNGHTPLMEAASAGQVDCARLLIDAGSNVNTHSYEFKETALTLACYKGNIDMVKFLLEKGADQEHKTDEMHTALMEACMDGHVEVARSLIEHNAQVNMPPDSFESPLTLAACGGHVELANLLIEQGADLEERNDEGYTPLMEAAREGHEEMVALLLFHDADINAITEETQETALTLACCGGCIEVARFLIEAGADVNLGASTPLMEASQEGHLELVELLLKSNALVNQCTSSGETALSLASENGHTEVAEFLVRAGAHVDIPDPEKGFTPLMKASRAGHVCTVQFLLSKGANINQATASIEHTVLSLACSGGHYQVVETLLANGADPCINLKDNSNCLIEAARGGHVHIVQMLLEWPQNMPQSIYQTTQTVNLPQTQQQQQHQAQSDEKLRQKIKKQHSEQQSRISSISEIDSDDTRCLSSTQVDYLSTKPDIALENLVNMLHKLAFGENSERVVTTTTVVSKKTSSLKSNSNSNNKNQSKEEQIKRKENLLKELQKIEKQLEDKAETQARINSLALTSNSNQISASSSSSSTGATCTSCSATNTNKSSSLSEMTNYQKICMINKYLITKCEDDLNKIRDENTQKSKKIQKNELNSRQIQEYIIEHLKTNDNNKNTALQQQEAELFKHLFLSNGSNSTLSLFPPPPPPPPPPPAQTNTAQQQQQQSLTTNQAKKRHKSQIEKSKSQEQIISKTLIEFKNFYNNNNNNTNTTELDSKKIPKSIDLETKTESNHDTALTLACTGGHEELVRLLIEKGANIEHRDKKGLTSLILAATNGHVKCVQFLVDKGADIEAQSERTKDTALSAACQAGKYEVVEFLLKHNANKEHRNISDYTPLSLAASGGYVNIIKLLLQHNCEINSRTGSKLGISPLMLAAMNGHTQTVRLLLDMGSDINAQIETNRNTALTLACFQGRHEVVALLLDRKANIEHRAKSGLTPLMEAASGGYEQVGRVLIDRGADVNAQPVPLSKDTALTIASEKGHLKFVQLLLDNCAQIEVKKKKGCTPLWLACNSGHLEVCVALVQNGANTDAQDSRKISCLMAAFRNGHDRVVKYMVKHVKQFPNDAECMRYISTITDKELLKKCNKCKEIIISAKEKQAQEANRAANNLLKELDLEKNREKNKKEAAARKREKRKMKKKQQLVKNQTLAQNLSDEAKKSSESESEEEYRKEFTKLSEQSVIKQQPLVAPITVKVPNNNDTSRKPSKMKSDELSRSTKISAINMEPKKEINESSLAALDDFEPFETKIPPSRKKVDEGWKEVKHNPKPKRVYVSNSVLSRVLGRSNCNIKTIYDLTSCLLEVEDKKFSNASEKSVILLKGSTESTKHANQLINELINNPDIDLTNSQTNINYQSLPTELNETQKLPTSKSNVNLQNTSKINSVIKNASSMGKLQVPAKTSGWPKTTASSSTKTPIISQTFKSTSSKTSQSQLYNPLVGSTLLSSLDLINDKKPVSKSTDTSRLNFAEVAKLGSSSSTTTAITVTSELKINSNAKRNNSISPSIEPSSQTPQQIRILKTDHSRVPLQPIVTQTQAKIENNEKKQKTNKPISRVTPLPIENYQNNNTIDNSLYSKTSLNELSQNITVDLFQNEVIDRNSLFNTTTINNNNNITILPPVTTTIASSNINYNLNLNMADLTLNDTPQQPPKPAPIGHERHHRPKQQNQHIQQQFYTPLDPLNQPHIMQSHQQTNPFLSFNTTSFLPQDHFEIYQQTQKHQFNEFIVPSINHSNSTSPKSLVPTPSPTTSLMSSNDSWRYQQGPIINTNGFMIPSLPPQQQPLTLPQPIHYQTNLQPLQTLYQQQIQPQQASFSHQTSFPLIHLQNFNFNHQSTESEYFPLTNPKFKLESS